MDLEPDYFLVL